MTNGIKRSPIGFFVLIENGSKLMYLKFYKKINNIKIMNR